MNINIIIVDDHKIFRDGLIRNFNAISSRYRICGEAGNEKELFELLNSKPIPDIILLDNILPGRSGIEITASLKANKDYRNIRVIILSAEKSPQIGAHDFGYVFAAIEAGADGFVLKNSTIDQIELAIQEVIQGGGFFLGETFNIKEVTREIISSQKKLISFLRKEKNFGLTNREVEVIQFLSEGLSAKEIALKMFITEDVVTSHKDNIKRKLYENYHIELKNMVELVVWAIKNKIISI